MSLYDYQASLRLAAQDPPFYALIMAAMSKADTNNLEKLTAAWPGVWNELYTRYHAPAGLLPDETSFDDKSDVDEEDDSQ